MCHANPNIIYKAAYLRGLTRFTVLRVILANLTYSTTNTYKKCIIKLIWYTLPFIDELPILSRDMEHQSSNGYGVAI